ncbi:unnamed protein product [Didymodactylos carnosus]|uniref:Uncharacterized protein n=1 Tax=Didymodactylos carnosus TaxID=1234261 RepID=A0A8S2CY83_9BILA|nr:unnamed protein product [Didymodactylos carnosus]CAF3617725.1 unnamed protein product [Didymodactylos carnosus]
MSDRPNLHHSKKNHRHKSKSIVSNVQQEQQNQFNLSNVDVLCLQNARPQSFIQIRSNYLSDRQQLNTRQPQINLSSISSQTTAILNPFISKALSNIEQTTKERSQQQRREVRFQDELRKDHSRHLVLAKCPRRLHEDYETIKRVRQANERWNRFIKWNMSKLNLVASSFNQLNLCEQCQYNFLSEPTSLNVYSDAEKEQWINPLDNEEDDDDDDSKYYPTQKPILFEVCDDCERKIEIYQQYVQQYKIQMTVETARLNQPQTILTSTTAKPEHNHFIIAETTEQHILQTQSILSLTNSWHQTEPITTSITQKLVEQTIPSQKSLQFIANTTQLIYDNELSQPQQQEFTILEQQPRPRSEVWYDPNQFMLALQQEEQRAVTILNRQPNVSTDNRLSVNIMTHSNGTSISENVSSINSEVILSNEEIIKDDRAARQTLISMASDLACHTTNDEQKIPQIMQTFHSLSSNDNLFQSYPLLLQNKQTSLPKSLNPPLTVLSDRSLNYADNRCSTNSLEDSINRGDKLNLKLEINKKMSNMTYTNRSNNVENDKTTRIY